MTSSDDRPRLFSVPPATPGGVSKTFSTAFESCLDSAGLRAKVDAEAVVRSANLPPEAWLAALLRVHTRKQIAYRLWQNPDIADALWEIIIKEK